MNKALVVGALLSYAAALRLKEETGEGSNTETPTAQCFCCGQLIDNQKPNDETTDSQIPDETTDSQIPDEATETFNLDQERD